MHLQMLAGVKLIEQFPLIQLPRKSEVSETVAANDNDVAFPLIQLPRKSEELAFLLGDCYVNCFH